tara:strand:+ start:411 stop:521 length:111 start_codon:yes stop_codon:yes gene_type:complete
MVKTLENALLRKNIPFKSTEMKELVRECVKKNYEDC